MRRRTALAARRWSGSWRSIEMEQWRRRPKAPTWGPHIPTKLAVMGRRLLPDNPDKPTMKVVTATRSTETNYGRLVTERASRALERWD